MTETRHPQNAMARTIDEIKTIVTFAHEMGALYVKFDGFECAFPPPALESREIPYDTDSEPEQTIKSWMTQRPLVPGGR